MKILVIGSGGREHALVWKLSQSPKVVELYCAPGNAGIGAEKKTELVDIDVSELDKLAEFADQKCIDLTVVGPELPLCKGIADVFEERGLKVFGPKHDAAKLEGSKAFAKELMIAKGIPTANCKVFSDIDEAKAYVKRRQSCVVKADGLAGGKGVFLCANKDEAQAALDKIMKDKVFGEAGNKVVIEEMLVGEEVSFMALMDGEHFLPLAASQDHKRIYNGDQGPNNGGVGAYSPTGVVDASMHDKIIERVLVPLIDEFKHRGIVYRGVLYVGIMITEEGPQVLEFNCRFGDPECQPLMMRLKTDLPSLLTATAEGNLRDMKVEWRDQTAVCVVMTSRGYPDAPKQYMRRMEIKGLDELASWSGYVFHAGTMRKDNRWYTNGGRVLGVTALGSDVVAAKDEAYRGVEKIRWTDEHHRTDIAWREVKRSNPRNAAEESHGSDLLSLGNGSSEGGRRPGYRDWKMKEGTNGHGDGAVQTSD